MKFLEQNITGVYLIELEPRKDHRGFFMRTFDEKIWEEQGLVNNWVQENCSRSERAGTIRGLHFQYPPYAETKLIRVTRGRLLDVFVDLRKGSPSYGKWQSVELNDEQQQLLYLPKGIAHGFCTLTDKCEITYKVDTPYSPDSEGGILWNDPNLTIKWPTTSPVISEKDAKLPLFSTIKWED